MNDADRKQNYTISLSPAELALIHKAAGYSRMGPEEFTVAAARFTIAEAEKNKDAILKLRKEESELLGVKRVD